MADSLIASETGPDRRRHRRATLIWLALALLIGLAATVAGLRAPWLQSVENGVRDAFVRLLASDAVDARIALVDIDEDSLRRIGPWPWPRAKLAELAERLLSARGARIVVFDLVLPERAVGVDAIGDARLAALARERLLVGAQAFDYVARPQPVQTGVPGGALPPVQIAAAAVSATGHVAGFEAFARGACVGNVGFTPDADGQMRRLPLLTRWQGRDYPTLALAAWLCIHDVAPAVADLSWLTRLPIDPGGQWQLRFDRTPAAFVAVPAYEVLAGEPGGASSEPAIAPLADRATDATAGSTAGSTAGDLPAGADVLRGRIVLVGSSALGLSDRVATPLASSMAGVLVHADALGELLDAAASTRAPWSPALVRAVALFWLALSTVLLWYTIAHARRLRRILSALAVVLAGWFALSVWIVQTGRIVPVSAPLWSCAFLLLVQLPAEWSAAQARVRARTRLLSRYVARPVLDELLAQENEDPLATRHAVISVLIADMQDYTRMTAFSTLEETAALTRGFLDCLTRPVLDGKGTLDKYTGDGLVAFWGAPLPVVDHAPRALQAALAIRAAVAQFNERRAARGELPVRVRIGLATGRALAGDLGTPFRSTYTAVGDVINLASRLQQAARDLDDDIVASKAFADACPGTVFRPIGAISPRGLDRIEVFSPS